jgi:putative ABC transport system permease protein
MNSKRMRNSKFEIRNPHFPLGLWRLAVRSSAFYWRTSLAVLLAVAVATGVLTGALAVGDSVRFTLARTLEARLGRTEFAVIPQGRYFRSALAADLEQRLGAPVAPVLQVAGILTNADGSQRLNRVQVLGVSDRFYALGPGPRFVRVGRASPHDTLRRAGTPAPPGDAATPDIMLSESVARQLRVSAGDEVVLRVEKPGLMPRDVPLVSDENRTAAFRLQVQAVADGALFGRFDLQANQVAPLNVFVPLSWLGAQTGQPERANMLLAAHVEQDVTADAIGRAVKEVWRPADAGLELRRLEKQNLLELRSQRIFIDAPVGAEAVKADANAAGVLTYFVNEIRLGDKATPYSTVAAVADKGGFAGLLPADMRDEEIVINQWLADDLDAKVGDSVDIAYYRLDPQRKLHEEQSRFKVVRIVPLDGAAGDATLMPEIPGLADVKNCRDWKPGVPVNLDKIRPKDEQYWNEHRGTPKAFITLAAGQKLWRNPYGSLTAVRYPWHDGLAQQLEQHLMSKIDPAAVGLFFQPVRARGAKAGRGGTDFGQLFLGLSMFLIAAALILTGLLFVFGVESRSGQVGMLRAVGWPAKRIKRLLLAEGGLVALLGTVLGVGAGLLYTRLMVYGLSTKWQGAVGGSAIYFHAGGLTLMLGGLGGLATALFAIWLTLRKQVKRSASELMSGSVEENATHRASRSRGRVGFAVAIVSFLGVAVLLLTMTGGNSQSTAGAFFGAGALLLTGTLGLSHGVLRMAGRGWSRPMISLEGLGLRNATRRSGRSLAIIGLLACGVFMVVAVGANRQNPQDEAQDRKSGTGGFALYGETSVAVLHDLNSESGRQQLGLAKQGLDGVEAVPFRVRDGDDASCLNLNRAQQPRLLGVQPDPLWRREAFTFTAVTKGMARRDGWDLLGMDLGPGVVPAVGDYPTVFWALGKNIGDEVEYTDEMGRPFRVRIVGILGNSILQGSLVIAENEFMARFPSADGYRVFLLDAPAGRTDAVARTLSSDLRDYGLVLTPASERLAAFSAVENTYLSIFMILGGLGLVLGSIGLGLVVLRNMFERRGELAMLRAVGFGRGRLQRMVFYEHWGLMLAGLLCGVISALVAVIPAMQSPAGDVPYATLLMLIAAIALSGTVWVWLAGTLAVRGRLLDALRNE